MLWVVIENFKVQTVGRQVLSISPLSYPANPWLFAPARSAYRGRRATRELIEQLEKRLSLTSTAATDPHLFSSATDEDKLHRAGEGTFFVNRSSLTPLICDLLLGHRSDDSEETAWLARAVATACLGENHLWQDMGLQNRDAMSALLRRHFTALFAKNTASMKWKKFFYKQLCDRAEVQVCRAPSCSVCTDYAQCFGSEKGAPPAPAFLSSP